MTEKIKDSWYAADWEEVPTLAFISSAFVATLLLLAYQLSQSEAIKVWAVSACTVAVAVLLLSIAFVLVVGMVAGVVKLADKLIHR